MASTCLDHDDAMPHPGRWWEYRWFCVLLVLVAAMPLLWPPLPPIGDLPGHMGRWHIAMALPTSPDLARYYAYRLAVIPNLGMDLLVPGLEPVFGFELATKLAVIAIPMLTVGGSLWVAHEAHGRVPPTAIFVVPLAYAWPFQFGFVNFALSQALAFCALALWIRLGRANRPVSRGVAFAVIACILWLAHSFGWGMFGLMAAGAELAMLREAGGSWRAALVGMVIRCLPLTVPVIAMLHPGTAGSSAGFGPAGWLEVPVKLVYALSILRDRWEWFDVASVIVLVVLLYLAARSTRLDFAAVLGWPALLCVAAFLALPKAMMGGAYVDMRIAPAALTLGVLAIAPARDVRFARQLAMIGMAFVALRIGGTTVSFFTRSVEQQRVLAVVDAIPRGAAVLSLVARPCTGVWGEPRYDQLPGLAIVRRDVFTNTQWALAGQQNVAIRYEKAGDYRQNPSQSIYASGCLGGAQAFAHAIHGFPRAAFTHVWTIGFPTGAAKAADLRVVWTNDESTLYRVVR